MMKRITPFLLNPYLLASEAYLFVKTTPPLALIAIGGLAAPIYFEYQIQLPEYREKRDDARYVVEYAEKLRQFQGVSVLAHLGVGRRPLPGTALVCVTGNPFDVIEHKQVKIKNKAETLACLEDAAARIFPPHTAPVSLKDPRLFLSAFAGAAAGGLLAASFPIGAAIRRQTIRLWRKGRPGTHRL